METQVTDTGVVHHLNRGEVAKLNGKWLTYVPNEAVDSQVSPTVEAYTNEGGWEPAWATKSKSDGAIESYLHAFHIDHVVSYDSTRKGYWGLVGKWDKFIEELREAVEATCVFYCLDPEVHLVVNDPSKAYVSAVVALAKEASES